VQSFYKELQMIDTVKLLEDESAAYPLLSADEEISLAREIQNPDRDPEDRGAINKLISHNIRLVTSIARTSNGAKFILHDKADLVAEGMLGLVRAAEKYDGRARFSTYASYWIRQKIARYVMANNHDIAAQIPEYMLRIRNKAIKASSSRGGNPAALALADIDDVKLRRRMLAALRKKIRLDCHQDAGCGRNGEWRHPDDILPPARTSDIEQADARDFVALAMRDLKPREAKIIRLYFEFEPLDGDKPATLKNIGDQFRLTRERIRQLIESSLKVMRRYAVEEECLSPDAVVTKSFYPNHQRAPLRSTYRPATAAV
jgi:RNA polymerase primary sigma factor